MTDMPATLIPEEIQDDLINAIEGCQNGVISMLVDFPGTVESSTNLAIVKSSNEMIEIQIFGSQFVREPQGSCLFEFGKYFLSSRGEGGIFGWLRRMAAEYRFADPENHAASLFGFVRKEAGG